MCLLLRSCHLDFGFLIRLPAPRGGITWSRSVSCYRTLGSASACTTAALSLALTSFGVPSDPKARDPRNTHDLLSCPSTGRMSAPGSLNLVSADRDEAEAVQDALLKGPTALNRTLLHPGTFCRKVLASPHLRSRYRAACCGMLFWMRLLASCDRNVGYVGVQYEPSNCRRGMRLVCCRVLSHAKPELFQAFRDNRSCAV